MADVIPFPHPKRGVRRRSSMSAAGLLSMMLLDRDGEPIPDNVQRFRERFRGPAPKLPAQSPELLLGLLLFRSQPAATQEEIIRLLRCEAYSSRADDCAIQLYNLLSGQR